MKVVIYPQSVSWRDRILFGIGALRR